VKGWNPKTPITSIEALSVLGSRNSDCRCWVWKSWKNFITRQTRVSSDENHSPLKKTSTAVRAVEVFFSLKTSSHLIFIIPGFSQTLSPVVYFHDKWENQADVGGLEKSSANQKMMGVIREKALLGSLADGRIFSRPGKLPHSQIPFPQLNALLSWLGGHI
jgi:hypothetical protein